MAESVLLRMCVEQSLLLEDLLTPGRRVPANPVWLGEAVQAFASFASLLERAQKSLVLRAGSGRLLDAEATGDLLAGLIKSALAHGQVLRKTIELAEHLQHVAAEANDLGWTISHPGNGACEVEGIEELDRALAFLKDLLQVHQTSWPRERVPTRKEAIAAHERGESLDPEEVFADTAQVSREVWRQRVAEHKAKYQSTGGA
ncbi:MAG: hypothetical protein L0Z62_37405 [Gemmataceae bacterium]|nr:hypothetical protein [Gemmataceae bacterium]